MLLAGSDVGDQTVSPIMESERREQLALRGPVRWQSMLLEPVGGKSNRLLTVQHISDDVWRKEGEVNHLLNAPFGCALAGSDLSEDFARFDLCEPVMRLCNIADKFFVTSCRCFAEDEFSFNAAFAHLERCGKLACVIVD